MLTIQSFTFNPFAENTYLVINEENHCWIVDPGMSSPREFAQFNDFITSARLIPQAIINTHAHIDHILGVEETMKKYDIPFGLHPEELIVLKSASSSAAMFGLSFGNTPTPTITIKEGEAVALGRDRLEVRFTPGHSPGSVIYYYKEASWAISGDVLFAGSIGRTDLPGGNFNTLMNSINQQLLTLPDNTTIYPGHGPASTILKERNTNPFLQ